MTIRIIRRENGTHSVWQDGEYKKFAIKFRKVRKLPIVVDATEMTTAFTVETLEGTMEGKAGDFLIAGIKGEMYPCDRDVFLATYEFIDE